MFELQYEERQEADTRVHTSLLIMASDLRAKTINIWFEVHSKKWHHLYPVRETYKRLQSEAVINTLAAAPRMSTEMDSALRDSIVIKCNVV